jgi:hypothetical protein
MPGKKIPNWTKIKTAYLSGMRRGEIAKRFNISEGTLKYRIDRDKWAKLRRQSQTNTVKKIQSVQIAAYENQQPMIEKMFIAIQDRAEKLLDLMDNLIKDKQTEGKLKLVHISQASNILYRCQAVLHRRFGLDRQDYSPSESSALNQMALKIIAQNKTDDYVNLAKESFKVE